LPDIRVLVVDDSREMREFVAQCILIPNGFEVVEATDGAEAVQKVREGGIDLMLLDLEMPKMNGFEVLDTLCTEQSSLPVILMTSHGSEAIAVEVFRKGVRDYVIKPFTADEMLGAIGQALTEVRLQREKEALTARLMQSNRQLEERLRELHTFYEIGKSVTALMDRAQLLDRVVDAALYITGAEEGVVFLQDEGVDSLREYVRKQHVPGKEQRTSSRTEIQLAADAMRKGDATVTAAALYAPLKVGDESIGALGVSNKVTGRSFTEHDRRLLVALADYAAVALKNARLLRQVEEAKEREKGQIRGLFERYVAPSVVEKLMDRPDTVQLGGVLQQATVLFADIRGFSDFSVRATPKVLVEVLNYHIAVATEAILAEGGTMDKFLGDGVLAYFNAPLRQEDHVLRAVRAAWRLCRSIEEAHKKLPEASRFHFGVGVSTGEVLVGNIGAPQMMNFTVIGDAVNVGRRLQQHARGGQILISHQVYELVQNHANAQPAGMLEVKGHPQPDPVYEVVSVQL
jgi:class 3 adenylate cyclase/DNA-binding response OmpR family regulator